MRNALGMCLFYSAVAWVIAAVGSFLVLTLPHLVIWEAIGTSAVIGLWAAGSCFLLVLALEMFSTPAQGVPFFWLLGGLVGGTVACLAITFVPRLYQTASDQYVLGVVLAAHGVGLIFSVGVGLIPYLKSSSELKSLRSVE